MTDLLAELKSGRTEDERRLIKAVLQHARQQGWLSDQQYFVAVRMLEVGAAVDAALTLVPEGNHLELTGQVGTSGWGTRITTGALNERLGLGATLGLSLCTAATEVRLSTWEP